MTIVTVVENVDQDQMAQIILSDLWSSLSAFLDILYKNKNGIAVI